MAKLRVIQWTTGKVGKHSTRAIIDDPRLELVGLYAHSADKAGKDAGELCGRPDTVTGIKATSDVDALIALKPDCVLYAPFEADLDHAVLVRTGVEAGAADDDRLLAQHREPVLRLLRCAHGEQQRADEDALAVLHRPPHHDAWASVLTPMAPATCAAQPSPVCTCQ